MRIFARDHSRWGGQGMSSVSSGCPGSSLAAGQRSYRPRPASGASCVDMSSRPRSGPALPRRTMTCGTLRTARVDVPAPPSWTVTEDQPQNGRRRRGAVGLGRTAVPGARSRSAFVASVRNTRCRRPPARRSGRGEPASPALPIAVAVDDALDGGLLLGLVGGLRSRRAAARAQENSYDDEGPPSPRDSPLRVVEQAPRRGRHSVPGTAALTVHVSNPAFVHDLLASLRRANYDLAQVDEITVR